MQFGGELKLGIRLHLLHPESHNFWLKVLIKGAVDLDCIEASREEIKRVKAASIDLWVNQSVPMRIRPSCGAKKGGGGHDRRSSSLFVRLIDNSEEEANLSRFIFVRLFDERGRIFNELCQSPPDPVPEVSKPCEDHHEVIVQHACLFSLKNFKLRIFLTRISSDHPPSARGSTAGYRLSNLVYRA